MLHNTSHRPLFKSDYKVMNNFLPWCIGIFYGESPETYYAHHLGMHHVENNMEHDLSSTLKYDRDNLFHFHHYFFTFYFAGMIQLWQYFTQRKRFSIRNWMSVGEMYFAAICFITLYFNWQASIVVFIIPFIVARYGMMAGNWAQHAFIDASDPENNYKNSITCINANYNQICFNDGYHIGHHLKDNRHWTDMPRDFRDNIQKYIDNGAVVFKKIDFFIIWFLLMTKNYTALANNYVQLDSSKNMTNEEIITLLKIKTRKVSK
jgi:fatty acid desaturase